MICIKKSFYSCVNKWLTVAIFRLQQIKSLFKDYVSIYHSIFLILEFAFIKFSQL